MALAPVCNSSGSEDESCDFDVEAVFESVVLIDNQFVNEGKTSGEKMVRERSYNDGYNVGKIEGSKLGQELGFYHGVIGYLQFEGYGDAATATSAMRAQRLIAKISRQIQRLSLSAEFLNAHDATMKESVQIIRSSFKSLIQSLDLNLQSITTKSDSLPDGIVHLLTSTPCTTIDDRVPAPLDF